MKHYKCKYNRVMPSEYKLKTNIDNVFNAFLEESELKVEEISNFEYEEIISTFYSDISSYYGFDISETTQVFVVPVDEYYIHTGTLSQPDVEDSSYFNAINSKGSITWCHRDEYKVFKSQAEAFEYIGNKFANSFDEIYDCSKEEYREFLKSVLNKLQ